jgi:hypothetical protein
MAKNNLELNNTAKELLKKRIDNLNKVKIMSMENLLKK